MVTITGYQQRKSAEGKTFFVLELEGGLQIQISQTTGKQYATKSKCSMACSFDEVTAREVVGTTLPGSIVRTPCEPYSFTNPNSGENMTLDYNFTYKAPEMLQEGVTPVQHKEEVDVN
ncbi:MAG: hypothetical protein ABIN01_13950 [Ferruginibacter sp.]